jgi:N-6 DNA Methylase
VRRQSTVSAGEASLKPNARLDPVSLAAVIPSTSKLARRRLTGPAGVPQRTSRDRQISVSELILHRRVNYTAQNTISNLTGRLRTSQVWPLPRRHAAMVAATHAERHLALRFILGAYGYDGAEIVEDFPIWLPGRGTLKANYVAFTRSDQQDMSTSAIVAQVIDQSAEIRGSWLPAAAALAAPAVLVAEPDRITVWNSSVDTSAASELISAPVTSPNEIVSRLATLTPDMIARAKAEGFQSSLFPVDLDLLPNSRTQARSYLKVQVEEALARMGGLDGSRRDEIMAKLVIGALATLMIRDKSDQISLSNATTGTLIDIANQRFPEYFSWLVTLTQQQFAAYERLIDDLGSSINFASLEPAMVSDVYELALVTPKRRRAQGTYYTPPQLAAQMLSVLPVESLEPRRRHILDPACGSGTMLLAAVNRLNQLHTDRVEAPAWHRYLTSHLRGYDRDIFATEITKLCLLMSALPIGNSWHVEAMDTLHLRLTPSDRPSIIISNPPWQFSREPENTAERANVFVSWMLDNLTDDGFLACVVPLSWLNRNNSRDSRISLLDRATLLEAWRLPASIFPSTRSTIAPAVIIAQKTPKGHRVGRVTLVKTVRNTSLSTFLSTGSAEEAYLVEPGRDGSRLTRGPLSRALESLDDFTTIGAIADVHNGRPQLPGRSERTAEESTHLELGSLRKLRFFGSADLDDLTPVRYPEDYFSANPSDARVRAHKVIVTAKNFTTNNPWRIAVGYDLYGVSLREMFHMVLPHETWFPWSHLNEMDRFHALMAVLGSGLASSWIDENEPTRNISTHRVQAMPFPTDTALIEELAGAGRNMAAAIAGGAEKRIQAAGATLESTVNKVYRLSRDAQALIASRLAGAVAFEGLCRYQLVDEASGSPGMGGNLQDLPSYGQVLAAAEDGLRIWISGLTAVDGAAVPALPQIPGWLCEEGSDFKVEGNLSDLQGVKFGFHLSEWLTEEELASPGLAELWSRTVDGLT